MTRNEKGHFQRKHAAAAPQGVAGPIGPMGPQGERGPKGEPGKGAAPAPKAARKSKAKEAPPLRRVLIRSRLHDGPLPFSEIKAGDFFMVLPAVKEDQDCDGQWNKAQTDGTEHGCCGRVPVPVRRYPLSRQDQEILEHWRYHAPKDCQTQRFQAINEATKSAAAAFLNLCPPSRERDQAIDALKMARMLANAAIALNE